MAKKLIDIRISPRGFQAWDFKKSVIKPAMRRSGRFVQKTAKSFVRKKQTKRRGKASTTNYPKKRTGALYRSITPTVSKSGFSVRIRPELTPEMEAQKKGENKFYPAFLYYGVRNSPLKGKARRKARRSNLWGRNAWRIKPTENYMVDALEANKTKISDELQKAVIKGIKKKALKI